MRPKTSFSLLVTAEAAAAAAAAAAAVVVPSRSFFCISFSSRLYDPTASSRFVPPERDELECGSSSLSLSPSRLVSSLSFVYFNIRPKCTSVTSLVHFPPRSVYIYIRTLHRNVMYCTLLYCTHTCTSLPSKGHS